MSLPDFGSPDFMQRVALLKEELMSAQQSMEHEFFEGTAANGLVTFKIAGQFKPVDIQIRPSLLQEAPEVVEQLLLAAWKNAYERAESAGQKKMMALQSQYGFPSESKDDAS